MKIDILVTNIRSTILIKKNSTTLSDFVWQYFSICGKKPERKLYIYIVHNVKGDVGEARKICQHCNLERLSIAAEDNHQV